jgi:hypothetical protein
MGEQEVSRIVSSSMPGVSPYIPKLLENAYRERAVGLAAVHKRLTSAPLPESLSPLRVQTREEYETFANDVASSAKRPRNVVETLSERTGIRF